MSQIPLDLFLACLTDGPQEIGLSLLESDRLGITIRDANTGRLLLRLIERGTYFVQIGMHQIDDTFMSWQRVTNIELARVNMTLGCSVNMWTGGDKLSQVSDLIRGLGNPIIVKVGSDVIPGFSGYLEFRGVVVSHMRDNPYGDLVTFELEIESDEIIEYCE